MQKNYKWGYCVFRCFLISISQLVARKAPNYNTNNLFSVRYIVTACEQNFDITFQIRVS